MARSLKIVGSLLLLTFLSACSSKSAPEKLIKELQTVSSWAATAEMTGNAWIHGNVPKAYAKQTLATAQEKLHKQTQTLFSSTTDSTQQRQLLEDLQQIESTVGQMSTAVEQKDRTAIAQQIQQLSIEQQKLSAITKKASR